MPERVNDDFIYRYRGVLPASCHYCHSTGEHAPSCPWWAPRVEPASKVVYARQTLAPTP